MATARTADTEGRAVELVRSRPTTMVGARPPLRSIVVYAAAALLAVWTIIPIYWMLNMSLMYKEEIVSVPAHLYPWQPTYTTFLRVFDLPAYGPDGKRLDPVGQSFLVRQGWKNSLIIALPVTLLTMLIALPIAYAMGRLQFKYKTGLLLGLLSTRSYPPIATVIPFSAVFFAVGLQSTVWGLMIIYLTLTVPLIAWVMSGFFASMPRSVESAARVDGLTRWGAFTRVLLPMAWPGIGACAVIAFLTCWNEFTFSLILTTGSSAQTYPPTLSGLLYIYAYINEVAAVCLLGMAPPAILAFLFQRRIRNLNIVNPL